MTASVAGASNCQLVWIDPTLELRGTQGIPRAPGTSTQDVRMPTEASAMTHRLADVDPDARQLQQINSKLQTAGWPAIGWRNTTRSCPRCRRPGPAGDR